MIEYTPARRKDGKEYEPDGRRLKKFLRKQRINDPVYMAHVLAVGDSMRRLPYRNPYPPGLRHDTYRQYFFA